MRVDTDRQKAYVNEEKKTQVDTEDVHKNRDTCNIRCTKPIEKVELM
jgi:hypothetical protein